MVIHLDTGAVLEKMEELCTALLQQESYQPLKLMIDRFASDE